MLEVNSEKVYARDKRIIIGRAKLFIPELLSPCSIAANLTLRHKHKQSRAQLNENKNK
jgi:hypothetical protein